MTLIHLIQRATIFAGMTFAGLSVYSNPASAQLQACIITSNGKTVCGQSREIERLCVTTDGSNKICGKFKSVKEEQPQEISSKPAQVSGYRKEVDNFVYTLEGCQRVDTSVRCQIRMVNKGKERRVQMYAFQSALVDSKGKSYPGSKADLGGGLGSSASATMSSGNDVSIAITFEDVQEQIGKAQVLNVAFSGVKPVQFRNVPISN
jgi:hypothetical protein